MTSLDRHNRLLLDTYRVSIGWQASLTICAS